MRPKPELSKRLFFELFIASWSRYPYMYVGKTCNANPTPTYPPCYASDISTELLKCVKCIVPALYFQRGMWIAVKRQDWNFHDFRTILALKPNKMVKV